MYKKRALRTAFDVLFLWVVTVSVQAEVLTGLGWKAEIDGKTGRLMELRTTLKGKEEIIPFRKDSMGGPSFEGIQLRPVGGNKLTFEGRLGHVILTLHYETAGDHLKVICKAHNEGTNTFNPFRLRLHIGVDAEMRSYPEWDDKFFPTPYAL
ncbi:MAG: hypothetical protein WCR53_07355 [Bacteroidaceae bacterium]